MTSLIWFFNQDIQSHFLDVNDFQIKSGLSYPQDADKYILTTTNTNQNKDFTVLKNTNNYLLQPQFKKENLYNIYNPDNNINYKVTYDYPKDTKLLIKIDNSANIFEFFSLEKEVNINNKILKQAPKRIFFSQSFNKADKFLISNQYLIDTNNYNNNFYTSIQELELFGIKRLKKDNDQNLLDAQNAAFEDGIWTNSSLCNNLINSSDKNTNISLENEQNKKFVRIKSSGYACLEKAFNFEAKNNKFYQLAFDYRNITGANLNPKYNFSPKNEELLARTGDFLDIQNNKQNEWLKYTFCLPKDLENLSQINLSFFSRSANLEQTNVNDFTAITIDEYSLENYQLEVNSDIPQQQDLIDNNFYFDKNNNPFFVSIPKTNLVSSNLSSFETPQRSHQEEFCINNSGDRLNKLETLSKDSTDGATSVEVTAIKDATKNIQLKENSIYFSNEEEDKAEVIANFTCVAKRFAINVPNYSKFKVQFDYKNVQGGNSFRYYIAFFSSDNEIVNVYDRKGNQVINKFGNPQQDKRMRSAIYKNKVIVDNKEWNTFSIDADVNLNNIAYFDVVLYSTTEDLPQKEKKTTNLFDNIRLFLQNPESVGNYTFIHQDNNYQPKSNSIFLEYKNINTFQHKVRLNGLKDSTLLYFPEEYSDKWKAYPIKTANLAKPNLPTKYDIKKEDKNRQASFGELKDLIDKNKISITGAAFVGKDFDNSIRNDNLISPSLFDVWGKYFINQDLHYQINNYANLWYIDFENLCQKMKFCSQNSDGTYDLELIIENDLTKIFVISIVASSTILSLLIATYLYLNLRKNYRENVYLNPKNQNNYEIYNSRRR